MQVPCCHGCQVGAGQCREPGCSTWNGVIRFADRIPDISGPFDGTVIAGLRSELVRAAIAMFVCNATAGDRSDGSFAGVGKAV